ncbi:MAG: hypothetical protein ABI878_00600 [Acidobacteriota bacterium]
MMQRIFTLLLVLLAFTALSFGQTKVTVRFARGTSSTTLSGSVAGYKYVDYRVGARGGQTMSVRLSTTSSYASFVVFDPAMQNVDGPTEQVDWSGELPSDGTYTIRVYCFLEALHGAKLLPDLPCGSRSINTHSSSCTDCDHLNFSATRGKSLSSHLYGIRNIFSRRGGSYEFAKEDRTWGSDNGA